MDTRPITGLCPKCGTAIPTDAPQGLCPRCVLAGAATPTEAGPGSGSRLTAPPLETVAAAFPQLEILGLIGLGGMGVVYKARQPKLDRIVALKLLPQSLSADPAFAERFNREARFLARLNHPNIVTVFDFGFAPTAPSASDANPQTSSSGFCYLLLEFVDGVNLRQAMRAGRFSPAEALLIVPSICMALQYAHEQGVLHRDIKPENILLDARGTVKLADFGIAKLAGEPGDRRADLTLTQSGVRLGTPHYMAPEQIEKPSDVDHRADIYSLGVVFYELLTGELPLGRFAPPSEKADLDTRVDAIVFRALAKERELRQQSAGEVKTEVEGLGTKAEPAPAPPLAKPTASGLSARFSAETRPLVLIGVVVALAWLLIALVRAVVRWGNAMLPAPVNLAIAVALAMAGWLVWRRRDRLLVPFGLGPTVTGNTDRFLRHAAGGALVALALIIGGQVALALGTLWAGLGLVLGFALLPVVLSLVVLWFRRHRSTAQDAASAPTPTALPAGLVRAGWLFLALGVVGLFPSVATWGSSSFQLHSGSLLLFTGIALLSRSAAWRQVALGTAAFALVLSLAGNLYIHVMASTGHLPDGWQFGIPGIPDSAGSAFVLAAVLCAAFTAALWLLTRTDVRAAYGLCPQTRKVHLRKRALIGGLTALTLLSLIDAAGHRGLPASSKPWAGGPEYVVPAPVPEGTAQARLEVTPPTGQDTALHATFWSNGVPVALPAVSVTVPPVLPNPQGQISRPVTWHLRAGLEGGVWELSEPVVGDAGRPQSSLRLTLPTDIALQPVAFIANAHPGPGERLRRWLFLPAADALLSNLPTQPTWGVSVDIEPQAAAAASAPEAVVQLIRTERTVTESQVRLRWELRSPVPASVRLVHGRQKTEMQFYQQGVGDFRETVTVLFERQKDGGDAVLLLGWAGNQADGKGFNAARGGNPAELLAKANELVADDQALKFNTQVWIAYFGDSQVVLEVIPDDSAAQSTSHKLEATSKVSVEPPARNSEVAQLELTFAQNRLADVKKQAEVGMVAPQGPEVLDAELAVAVAEAALKSNPLAEIQARLVHAERLLAITNAMHRVGKATSADLEGAQLAVARAKARVTLQASLQPTLYREDLATAFRLARNNNLPWALVSLGQVLRDATANPVDRMVFRLGDSAYEFNHNLESRLTALKALLATRAGNPDELREAQIAGAALWPIDGVVALYDVWVDHFVPGRADQDTDEVRVLASELRALRLGQEPQVTVIHRFKESGKPSITNLITGDWLNPR